MKKEIQILEQHVTRKGLKHSTKRDQVVDAFLKVDQHVSAEDLHELVKKENPTIGYTTVYRTLKLMVESGLAEMVDFNDGVKRFEKKLGREQHAHFVCTKCGKNFEVFDEHIKELSLKLAETQGFVPHKQRFEIFGVCQTCH